MRHFDSRGGHEKDNKANEGEDVLIHDFSIGEGKGREPDIIAVGVKRITGINPKRIGVSTELGKKGTIGRVADEDRGEKEHDGGNREGYEVGGSFLEPVAKSFTPWEGIHEDLDWGSNSLDDDHDISFDQSKHEFEHSNDKGDGYDKKHG